ncbi:MAG: hypothetical protein PHR06_14305, partial [Candidatus Cloacimonetes bacterium]|nr:hypothetical protein [Candidatus Cloacimonadota bacterium]
EAELEIEIVGPSSVTEQIGLSDHLLRLGANHVFIDGSIDRKAIASAVEVGQTILVCSPNFGQLDEIIDELTYYYQLSRIEPYLLMNDKKSANQSIIYRDFTKRINVKENSSIRACTETEIIESGCRSLIGNETKISNLFQRKDICKIFINGAITERSFSKISDSFFSFTGEMILSSPLHLSLRNRDIKKMISSLKMKVLHPFRLVAIGVNSFAVNGNHIDCDKFRNTVRNEFPDIPVLDVREAR